jgi:hypothetical protein
MLFDEMLTVSGTGTFTLAQFAAGVRAQLQRVQAAPAMGNERTMITTTPGTFGPSCPKHETLGDDDSIYNVSIDQSGVAVPFLQVFGNWLAGTAGITNLVTLPGGHDSCLP